MYGAISVGIALSTRWQSIGGITSRSLSSWIPYGPDRGSSWALSDALATLSTAAANVLSPAALVPPVAPAAAAATAVAAVAGVTAGCTTSATAALCGAVTTP